jgi:hypothetical protein
VIMMQKQSYFPSVPGMLGAGVGAYSSPEGEKWPGAGHGLITGEATGLGAGLGAIGGGAVGAGGGAVSGAMIGELMQGTPEQKKLAMILGMLAGGIPGAIGGGTVGGMLGYKGGQGISKMIGGEAGSPWNREPRPKSKKKEKEAMDNNVAALLGAAAASHVVKCAMHGRPCKVTKLSVTTHQFKPQGGGDTPSETDQAKSREIKSAAAAMLERFQKDAQQPRPTAAMGQAASSIGTRPPLDIQSAGGVGSVNPGGGPASTGAVPMTGPMASTTKLPTNAAGMPQGPGNVSLTPGQTNTSPTTNLGV